MKIVIWLLEGFLFGLCGFLLNSYLRSDNALGDFVNLCGLATGTFSLVVLNALKENQ